MASLNSELLQLAREFYFQYLATTSQNQRQEPVGVVVNVDTRRCALVFAERSALLPQEIFISLRQFKS